MFEEAMKIVRELTEDMTNQDYLLTCLDTWSVTPEDILDVLVESDVPSDKVEMIESRFIEANLLDEDTPLNFWSFDTADDDWLELWIDEEEWEELD